MKMKHNIFTPVLVSLVVCSALSLAINSIFPLSNVNDHWIYSIAFLCVLSLGLNIVYIQKTDSRSFANTIMSASIIRFLGAAVAFFIYSLAFPLFKLPTVIHFMLHYFVFAIFEILFLLKIVKANSTETTVN